MTVAMLGNVSCAMGGSGTVNVTCNGRSGAGVAGGGSPSTDVTTLGGLPGSAKWAGGVLAANGMIYGIPYSAPSVLIIDPVGGSTDTTTLGGLGSGSDKWAGGVLAPNGKMYGIPLNAMSVLIIDPATIAPPQFVLSGCPSTCPAAQYSASTAQPCAVCPAGSVVEVGSGTGAVSANGTACTACGAGQYSPSATVACIPCPVGRYQPNAGRTNCSVCSLGYTSSAGASSCTPLSNMSGSGSGSGSWLRLN
jgi:hypothetical protein